MIPTIPQGFIDSVNATFALKVTADASAAAAATQAAAVAEAQAALSAANAQASADAAALNTSRQQLEALDDAYLTVGGTLPDTSVSPAG
jgi:ABC-type Na+ efflux pump permease subunit